MRTIQAIKVFREAGQRFAIEHGGRLVDSPGDNLLFEFDRAAHALDASLRFQEFVLGTNEQYAPEDRMQFRIGMHSGEVVVDSDRIYGSGINIAARLEHLARPGGICISETVRHELERSPALEDIGPQQVKNIPYPIHAFFVDVPGQELPARLQRSAWPAITVLPFETAEGDQDAEYLADGLAEHLITTPTRSFFKPLRTHPCGAGEGCLAAATVPSCGPGAPGGRRGSADPIGSLPIPRRRNPSLEKRESSSRRAQGPPQLPDSTRTPVRGAARRGQAESSARPCARGGDARPGHP